MNIHFENVSKQFKTDKGIVEAVARLNLAVGNGQFFTLLGPSGCGKSTLLNLTAGLEEPTSGRIRFGDRVVASAEQKVFQDPGQRNVAMVFQSYALYPHMNVFENIAFPLRNSRRKESEINQAVQQTAAMLDITNLLGRKPGALSGGQRQRVAICRALVRRPSVFLLDEPLSNLDAQLRSATRAELKKLQRQLGVTTLYVTHDQTEAMTLGEQVALLKNGRLVQVGTPEELYNHPADPFAATFIGSPPMNLIPAGLKGSGRELFAMVGDQRIHLGPELRHKVKDLKTADVLLGLRPERIWLSEEGPLKGEISTVEYMGRETIFRVVIPEAEILVLSDQRDRQPGQIATLAFDTDFMHIFAVPGDGV